MLRHPIKLAPSQAFQTFLAFYIVNLTYIVKALLRGISVPFVKLLILVKLVE